MNGDTPENQVEWVDEEGKIYNSTFTFREDAAIEKQIEQERENAGKILDRFNLLYVNKKR